MVVLFLLLLAAIYPAVVRVVPAGAAGVIYKPLRGGTVTDRIFGEGVHVKYPWDTLYVYNTRIQTILHDFTVLTNKGLPVTLRLAIRFHPEREMIGRLHKQVGPNYAETIIVYQIESVLRKRLGKEDPEDIYTNRSGTLTDVFENAIEEVGQRYVRITDVIIREIVLPSQVVAAIEEKLVHQQKLEAYEFRLETQAREAERMRIEAAGIRDYQATINETLSKDLIVWQGVNATVELAQSDNAKIVVVGSGDKGLPVILGADSFATGPEGTGGGAGLAGPGAAVAANAASAPAPAPAEPGGAGAMVMSPDLRLSSAALPPMQEQVQSPVSEPVPQQSPRPGLEPLPQLWAFLPPFLQPKEGPVPSQDPAAPRAAHEAVPYVSAAEQTGATAAAGVNSYGPMRRYSPLAGEAMPPFVSIFQRRYSLPLDPVFDPHAQNGSPVAGRLGPTSQHTARAQIGKRGLIAAEFLQNPSDILP